MKKYIKTTINSKLAFLTLFCISGFAYLVVTVLKLLPGAPTKNSKVLLVTGTFHNPNWFISHASPLAESGMEKVIFVSDEVQYGVNGVMFICAPKWMQKIFGRALSKFIYIIIAGYKFRPGMYMGYHIFPSAISSLVAAKLFGGKSCYQICAGPIEFIGGGNNCENRLMKRLGGPYSVLERILIKLIREIDLNVVRGKSAKEYLKNLGISEERIVIIPGSVKNTDKALDDFHQARHFDLIFVGRLEDIKQPEQVVYIVQKLKERKSQVKALFVGDGPLHEKLTRLSLKLGLTENISFAGKVSNVEQILSLSKNFILTSKSEGLSIAMAEAMNLGNVPVVADVGDLGDLVKDGENGFLIRPNDIDQYAEKIMMLMNDDKLWRTMSERARISAISYNGQENVSRKWRNILSKTI